MTSKIKSAKAMVMQPKHASSTIKPDKGKGSYSRIGQMDWIEEYETDKEDDQDDER